MINQHLFFQDNADFYYGIKEEEDGEEYENFFYN